MKPRAAKITKSSKPDACEATAAHKTLDKSISSPPNVFVLPKDISSFARIVSIPGLHNKSKLLRLLVCPEKGFFEFTNIVASGNRSWLLAPDDASEHAADNERNSTSGTTGYVMRKPDLLVATPIDPLFVILAMMSSSSEPPESYLTCSDYIFAADLQAFQQLQSLLRSQHFAKVLLQLEQRLKIVSDALDLGEETMYRLSIDKLCNALQSKAIRLADNGLPPSMEERFVRQALEVPALYNEDAMDNTTTGNTTTEDLQSSHTPTVSSTASQHSITSATSNETSMTSISGASEGAASQDVQHLLRVKTAFEYMLKSYIAPALHDKLSTALSAQKILDFKPLLEFEERVSSMRFQAQALRTLSDNISRKRAHEDDESVAKAEEKRRKKEEEDQRKRTVSQGVKKLMKADTSGMKKLSSFFAKKPSK